jgi:hypothetical protein
LTAARARSIVRLEQEKKYGGAQSGFELDRGSCLRTHKRNAG